MSPRDAAPVGERGDPVPYGCDPADQLDLAPKNILTSVMENMSVAIFRMAKSVDAGKFEGKNNVIGLEAPQVARLGTYNSIVPQDIRRQVEDVKKLLISKTIVQK